MDPNVTGGKIIMMTGKNTDQDLLNGVAGRDVHGRETVRSVGGVHTAVTVRGIIAIALVKEKGTTSHHRTGTDLREIGKAKDTGIVRENTAAAAVVDTRLGECIP
jgi:hypothetical protein